MIRALLAGDKTQTRRKAWREAKIPAHFHDDPSDPTMPVPTIWQKVKPGDRLWCREMHSFGSYNKNLNQARRRHRRGQSPIVYSTDRERMKQYEYLGWRPSIHMPRWASRLTLIVTEKRLEQVQDINEEDAKAEGVLEDGWEDDVPGGPLCTGYVGRLAFETLWVELHGRGAWDENPEIVALIFTVHKSNIDAMETEGAAHG